MLTFGSLFSGIGGFDLGLERAGMQCKWQIEIDPFCRQVLAKHWPHVARYGDITQVISHSLEKVDVICGGFPCQDISTAGHTGLGIARGSKSGLWKEFHRIVHDLKPEIVLIENVEAIRHSKGGLGIVLDDLDQTGYDAEWTVLRASDFGAPHKRARLWLVAYPNSSRQSNSRLHAKAPILPESCSVDRSWPNPPSDLSLDDGISRRLGNSAYGNALLPQIAEYLGRHVLAAL